MTNEAETITITQTAPDGTETKIEITQSVPEGDEQSLVEEVIEALFDDVDGDTAEIADNSEIEEPCYFSRGRSSGRLQLYTETEEFAETDSPQDISPRTNWFSRKFFFRLITILQPNKLLLLLIHPIFR